MTDAMNTDTSIQEDTMQAMDSPTTNDGAVLDLDGIRLRLRWDLGAISHFERLTGEALGPDFRIGAQHLLYMLYAAVVADARFRRTDPVFDMHQIGTMLDTQAKMQQAVDVIGSLTKAFFGGETEAEAGPGDDEGED